MRTFLEWANQETDLFEMAIFKKEKPEETYSHHGIEIDGPDVYTLLKSKPAGMPVEELVNGMLNGAKFREAGATGAFVSLEAIAKEKGKEPAALKKMIVDMIKDKIRSQKGSGWKKYIQAGPVWKLKPDADDLLTTARSGQAKKEDKKDEWPFKKAEKKEEKAEEKKPEAEEKKGAAPKAKSGKAGQGGKW